MENKMFCYQCQETLNNKGCTSGGRCGKTAEVANLQDQLIAELKALALALEGRTNVTREYSRFICRAMTATLTNTNFNYDRIYFLIDETRRYLNILGATVQSPDQSVQAGSNAECIALRELLMYGLKGICAYAFHALSLGHEDNTVYDFIIKALVAAAKPETTEQRLTLLVMECGRIATLTMAMLDDAHTSTYGNPAIKQVSCEAGTNPAILMSGHDLKDLEELLIQTDGTGVDVYTHGELLPAHAYPAFRKFAHFKGNYGNSWYKQGEEFAAFNGPIIVNSNCLIPVRDEYRNRLFTTGMCGYPEITHIPHRHIGFQKDFSKVIELAKTLPAPTKLEEGSVFCGFAHNQMISVLDQIIHYMKSGSIRRFVIIAGCDGRDESREYYTKLVQALPDDVIILTAGCMKYRFNKLNLGKVNGIPRVLDAGQCNDTYSLIRIALAMQDACGVHSPDKLPVSIVLGWYEQKAVAVLLSLLSLGFQNIRLGPTLPAFCPEKLTEVLIRDYGIKMISTPEEDAAAIMEGK